MGKDKEVRKTERGQTSREEGAPPPAVVLGTQVEVAQEDGCLCTHHYQNNEGQQKEPKHVVHLTTPTSSGRREEVTQQQQRANTHQILLRMKKS